MPFDFRGKKVLETGAGKGIGLTLAIALSHDGCKVYALSRTKSTLDALVEECPGIIPTEADLCNWDDTREKLEKLEVLDGLVNNAGIDGHDYTALECPKEFLCKLLDNNLLSAINCSQVVAKKMIEAKIKGSIVNISSIAGLASFPNGLPYNVSKAGMDMATKQFALELGPHGIRVNSVNPALVRTPMMQDLIEKGLPMESLCIERCPMDRIIEVHEVVDPILYLLSDHSSMVTRQTHVVDGGILSNITVKI
ncbi:L-xylulose reductase-like [Mercenaria mercenaria]|uniref:L-xylulose reductase-like n=1 Tax=Mercenaria mercenaria TaxID=6596 RepID=UPI00234EE6A1|nr:L-xylulose reductase-like [Mercenaria mercenaria]